MFTSITRANSSAFTSHSDAFGEITPALLISRSGASFAAITDFAERGCACQADKECFRAVRDEWEAARGELVKNARLLTGDDKQAYDAARLRFGHCGDAAGLTVFDKF